MKQTISYASYAVDGLFFTQRVSGIQRYSLEILAQLDAMLPAGLLEVVVPPGTATPAYQNIRVVEFGRASGGFLWEQLDYPRYLRSSGRHWLCTCNVIPLFAKGCNGIAVLHDVCYRARPDFYTGLRPRLSALWHRLQYRAIAKRATKIVTVSAFSKSEICKYYPVQPGKITVIYNAWQQLERIPAEADVFAGAGKWPQLKKGEYYFSMANLLKNKNFPWILQAAKNKPEAMFAIAGGGSLAGEAQRLGLADLPNVLYLGYVTDGEAKTLMESCKAFLFPTLYEGFGIPPLEAIACGAPQVYVSNTPCMREIYGGHAGYIDLQTNPGNVDAVTPGHNAKAVLARYSWEKSAAQLRDLLLQ